MRKNIIWIGIAFLTLSYILFFVNVLWTVFLGNISYVVIACGIVIPKKSISFSNINEEYGVLLIVLSLVLLPTGKVGLYADEYFYSLIWLFLGSFILTGILLFYLYRIQQNMSQHFNKSYKTFHTAYIIYALGYFGGLFMYGLFFALDEAVFDNFFPEINFEGWAIGIIVSIFFLIGSTISEVIHWIFFYKYLNEELSLHRASMKKYVKMGLIVLIITSLLSIFFIGLVGVSIFDFMFPFIDVDYYQITTIILTCHIIGDVLYLVGFLLSGVPLVISRQN